MLVEKFNNFEYFAGNNKQSKKIGAYMEWL